MSIGMKESDASALMTKALTTAGFATQGLFAAAQFGGEKTGYGSKGRVDKPKIFSITVYD